MTTPNMKDIEFIGFDLGHGETALARAFGQGHAEPEILEYRGVRSLVTAVSKDKGRSKNIRIGAEALTLPSSAGSAKVWAKFKSSDLDAPDVREPLTLFTQALIQGLTEDGSLRGPKESHFVIGCPSGWSNEVRQHYRNLFVKAAGLKEARIVSESRAALMTALEQGYLSMEDARASVLIVDIGSSTTDLTYCRDLAADDVGHNILGSGLLDTEIFETNLARQPQRKRIEALLKSHPAYRPILEFWCREAKEAYFTGEDKPVEMIRRLPVDKGLLFEIRIDKADADAILSKPLDALHGYSWTTAFDFALRETIERLGGRDPDTVLLTGGAARLPLVLPATKSAFPRARVIRGAEPEFAIARGLAWLGRFEFLHASFKHEVGALMEPDGDVTERASEAARKLGETLAPALVDGLTEDCIKPAFRSWRSGAIASLDEVEAHLTQSVADWLRSDTAQAKLRPVIGRWFADLQREIETITDPLCREHGLPAMVLSLDESHHVSQHLEGLSLAAPKIGALETDTALLGTTLAAILVSALLAHANLFAPLLMNPLGLLIGGAVAGGSYLYGRRALAGRFRGARVPVVARQVLTEKRIDQAINKQRPELIEAVRQAWDGQASQRFSEDLTDMLGRALLDRADERAVLFLI